MGIRPFAKVDVATMTSERAQALSWPTRWALVAVASQFNGHNNGRLLLTKRRLEPWGFVSDATIAKARKELLAAGILIECKPANRYTRRAAEYALCWEEIPHHQQKAEFDDI